MESNIISIIKGISIELFFDNTNKIKIKKLPLTTLKQLLSVEDWEWYYLSFFIKKDTLGLSNEDIIKLIISAKSENGLIISKEQARKFAFEEPDIAERIIYNTKKIQQWFRYCKKIKAANYIKNWWLHYYYKPSSNLGIKKACQRFNTIQSTRNNENSYL